MSQDRWLFASPLCSSTQSFKRQVTQHWPKCVSSVCNQRVPSIKSRHWMLGWSLISKTKSWTSGYILFRQHSPFLTNPCSSLAYCAQWKGLKCLFSPNQGVRKGIVLSSVQKHIGTIPRNISHLYFPRMSWVLNSWPSKSTSNSPTRQLDKERTKQMNQTKPNVPSSKAAHVPVYHRSDRPLTFQQKVFFSLYFLVPPSLYAVEFTSTVCIWLRLNTDIRPRMS